MGFMPFGPYRYNPTQDIAERLHKSAMFTGDLRIIGKALPVSYKRAPAQAIELIEEYHPQIILGMGLASRKRGITIEIRGNNRKTSPYRDIDGEYYYGDGHPIDRNGKPFYCTTADEKQIIHRINKNGIAALLSYDAERFVCNALIYGVAKYIAETDREVQFSYMHTPWTDAYLKLVKIEPGKEVIPAGHLRIAAETALACMYQEVAV